jgi:hypothetical protein
MLSFATGARIPCTSYGTSEFDNYLAFGRGWQGTPCAPRSTALRPWHGSKTVSDSDDRFNVIAIHS